MESRSSSHAQVTTTVSKKSKRKGQHKDKKGHILEEGVEELTLSIDLEDKPLEDKPKVNGVHSPLEEEEEVKKPSATSPTITADSTGINNNLLNSSVNNVKINTHERCSSTSPPALVSFCNGDSDLGCVSEGEVSGSAGVCGYLTSCDRLLTLAKEGEVDPEFGIRYLSYESELQMPSIMKLIQKDLSEPYSVYTYRYFIHNWPKLCFLAMDEDRMVGAIVCKLDVHKQINKRGYIAMLAVDEKYRRKKIGSNLVLKSIRAMAVEDADEANLDFGLQIVLETEITNKSALRLYENLGFVRDKRLFRYYLNGVDALRLKLWLK